VQAALLAIAQLREVDAADGRRPRTALQRLADLDADLLASIRRHAWKARASVRNRPASAPPIVNRVFWSAQRSSGVGIATTRSNDVRRSSMGV
jgi:hypothetical protein